MDREALSDIVFFESKAHQKNRLFKAMMWLCGGFIKPSRFLILSIFLWFIFSMIFWLSKSMFVINSLERVLTLPEAFYFSGITLTTIGYGDIQPLGFSRGLCVVEGFLGVITLSCFVVSLVRRFVADLK
ncbi:MAG: potassium channel family protein [Candidatus Omnitrophica bacterium]|nr:potassium channel family protein [Candidatus Omnitrophota bacterium]